MLIEHKKKFPSYLIQRLSTVALNYLCSEGALFNLKVSKKIPKEPVGTLNAVTRCSPPESVRELRYWQSCGLDRTWPVREYYWSLSIQS